MKQKLLSLYNSRHQDFVNLSSQYREVDLHGPFLMSPNSIYDKQKLPLLIIGQETYGWDKNIDDLSKQMDSYEKFNVAENYYSSPFWNIARKTEKALGNEQYSCAWTNISKYDGDGGRAYGEYEIAISTLDDLLIDEIQITQPKVCLFFTGPAFDNRLKTTFENIEFIEQQGWTTRQLCRLKHPCLPEHSFRAYHPNFLRRSGFESDFIKFVETIPFSNS